MTGCLPVCLPASHTPLTSPSHSDHPRDPEKGSNLTERARHEGTRQLPVLVLSMRSAPAGE
jgi:hypothetical protein